MVPLIDGRHDTDVKQDPLVEVEFQQICTSIDFPTLSNLPATRMLIRTAMKERREVGQNCVLPTSRLVQRLDLSPCSHNSGDQGTDGQKHTDSTEDDHEPKGPEAAGVPSIPPKRFQPVWLPRVHVGPKLTKALMVIREI